MIAYLKGVLRARTAGSVVIDVNGVGYLVGVSSTTSEALGAIDAVAELHIQTVVREDAIALYGFHSSNEKETYRLLSSVQGVGPKVALSLLGALPDDALVRAIAGGDHRGLTAADGVGPKLATRICSELRSKFELPGVIPGVVVIPGQNGPANTDYDDAISALVNLGYSKQEGSGMVAEAMKQTPAPRDLSDLIKRAIRIAGSRNA